MTFLLALAWGAPGEPVSDYRSHVDQATFFLKKGWYTDALAELERAVSSPDGALDGGAWTLLAEVRTHLGDIEGALVAADRAHTNSRNDDELERAAGLSEWLRHSFGVVRVETHFDGVRSAVQVELASLILDPELKGYLAALTERLGEPQTLPVRFGLPVGRYRINGREVVVEAGARTAARVPVRGAPPEPLQVTELEVSAGVAAWAGRGSKGMLPGPHLRGGLTQPLGDAVVGAAVDWSPLPIVTPDGLRASLGDVGFAVHGGMEVGRVRDAVLRAELSARAARISGVGFPCDRSGPVFMCGAGSRPLLWTYPPGWAAVPGVELSAVAVDRRRRTALGWGVRVIGEVAWGRRVAAGSGRMGNDGFEYTLADADRPFLLGGLRVLATVVWAR